MATALFIRHQARSGQRDLVRQVWETFVQPRAKANPRHEAYYYCYDDGDPDVIMVYQQYPDAASAAQFMDGTWYADYLKEVGQYIAKPPHITTTTVMWAKAGASPSAS